MAGDWIKMRVNLYGDQAVKGIAKRTGLSRFEVIGRLHAVWSWADQHLRNGNAPGVTPEDLDEEAKHPGFAQAMADEQWLKILSTGISFPDFDKHNGKPAKERGLTAKRVKRHRNAQIVTSPLPEKRREEHSSQAASGVETGVAHHASAAAGEPPPDPGPESLAVQIFAECAKAKVSIDDTTAKAWAKAASIVQVRKALELARSPGRKPLPEGLTAAYVSPILREIVGDDRKTRRAANARVDATQQLIAKQGEDAKRASTMPEGLKPRRRGASNPEAPKLPFPPSWAVTLSLQVAVLDKQPSWDSDHIELVARDFRKLAPTMGEAADWDEVFVAFCAKLPSLVRPAPTVHVEEPEEEIADDDPMREPAWWLDDQAVITRGAEEGVHVIEGQDFEDFKARVIASCGAGPWLEAQDDDMRERIEDWRAAGINPEPGERAAAAAHR